MIEIRVELGCIVTSNVALLFFATGATDHGSVVRNPFSEAEFYMANIKSQIKRNRQTVVRRERNKSVQSDLKTAIKKVQLAAVAGEPTADLIRDAQKKIDVATSKGVLHKNTAARKKSRLSHYVTRS